MTRRLFKRLIVGAGLAAALLSGVTGALAAFTPGDSSGNGQQVRSSVVAGRAYLISQQNQGGVGCWMSSGVVTGVTALAVLALVNSEPGGYANLDPTTKASVDAGAACLMAQFRQEANPNEGTFRDCSFCGFHTYNTSLSIWALSDVPSTPAIATAIQKARTWFVDNQANHGNGRADAGGNVDNGGWFYEGGTTPPFVEHSNSSFALQGLEASGGIPPATADLAQGFWICLQRVPANDVGSCLAGGGPFDSGFIYSHEINKGGTETSATGSGTFALLATGVPATDSRVMSGINYLDASMAQPPNACQNQTHTTDNLVGGWFPSNTLDHYAVWASFKAHDAAGIPTSLSDSSNWYYKLADCLTSEQLATGQWPESGREDAILATAFSMLTLEKVTPEAPISGAQGVPVSATEGTQFCGPVATFQDSDNAAKPADYVATIDWGDGTTSAGTVSASNGTFTVSGCNTYAEERSYTITVMITDADNSSNNATVTTTATVVDAALTSSCAMPTTTSQAYAGPTATFNDLVTPPAGTLDDFSATISWGDGSSSPANAVTIGGGPSNVPYTVSGSHVYTSTGFFTVTTVITDVGGSTTTATCSNVLIFAFSPGGGSFVIGDLEGAPGTHVMFWGAQWWKNNPTSNASKVASFKGFAESPATPSCGVGWSADPGNSTPPPNGPLPAYMAVIVTSSYSKSGSTISGDTVHIVVVKTDAGYQPNPGHPGTGTVVQQAC